MYIVLVGQPFDTIKVRLQTQPHLYTSTLDAFIKTIRPAAVLQSSPSGATVTTVGDRGGVFALYRGTLSPLLGIGLCTSIQFGVLETAKRAFTNQETGKLSLGGMYAAGTLAGLANGLIAGPVEHIRVRLQVQTTKAMTDIAATASQAMTYHGTLDAYRKIWSAYGLKGLCKGQVPTFLREASGYGVYFTVYDRLMEQAAQSRYKGDRTKVAKYELMLYGALAGYALWLTCFPFVNLCSCFVCLLGEKSNT